MSFCVFYTQDDVDSWKASFLRAGVYPEKSSEAMNGDGEVIFIWPLSVRHNSLNSASVLFKHLA